MPLQTDRLGLPLLAVAQAQKEMTHNAALAQLDMSVHAAVEAVAPPSIPTSPTVGQCWIVGVGATGLWADHDNALAAWTAGGWRFLAPVEGMCVWCIADGVDARYVSGGWVLGTATAARVVVDGVQVVGAQQPAISVPLGGTVIDSQARSCVAALLAALAAHGLIAS